MFPVFLSYTMIAVLTVHGESLVHFASSLGLRLHARNGSLKRATNTAKSVPTAANHCARVDGAISQLRIALGSRKSIVPRYVYEQRPTECKNRETSRTQR